MKKRSVSILGHQTSITLEDEFWEELKSCAKRRDVSLNALIAEIDEARAGQGRTGGLSSAIRIYILRMLRESPPRS